MAIKQNYIIEDKVLNEKYEITGQSGIYKQEDYKYTGEPLLKEENRSHRFVLLDLWALGTYGAEQCPTEYNIEKEICTVTIDDIDTYVHDIIEEITDGLYLEIKDAILEEIKADDEETIKLVEAI